MNTSEIQDSLRRIIANDNCTTEQLIDRLFDFVDARVQEAEKSTSAPTPMAEGLREAVVRAAKDSLEFIQEVQYDNELDGEDAPNVDVEGSIVEIFLSAVAPFVGTEDEPKIVPELVAGLRESIASSNETPTHHPNDADADAQALHELLSPQARAIYNRIRKRDYVVRRSLICQQQEAVLKLNEAIAERGNCSDASNGARNDTNDGKDGERIDLLESLNGVTICRWDGGKKISTGCKHAEELEREPWHGSLRSALDDLIKRRKQTNEQKMNTTTDSINQIEEALEAASGHLSGPINADRRGLDLLCEQAKTQIPAIRDLVIDAERYRHLRAHWDEWTGTTWHLGNIAQKLDAAIDAARQSAQGGGT